MKILIDHDTCRHAGAFSDRCLSATILNPLGHERYCMAKIEEDGRPELTVTLKMEGKQYTLVIHSEEQRKAVAYEGWTAFTRSVEPIVTQ